MKRYLLRALHRVAHSPSLNLLAGIVLLSAGILECFEGLSEDLLGVRFGVHHGLVVFGLLHVLKTLPDVMKGLKFVEDGEKVFRPDAKTSASQSGNAV